MPVHTTVKGSSILENRHDACDLQDKGVSNVAKKREGFNRLTSISREIQVHTSRTIVVRHCEKDTCP